ncbi:MAG: thioesterase, partial [Myxococcales bacterium]|nr:thioesterase [Myxococcales bacterium]
PHALPTPPPRPPALTPPRSASPRLDDRWLRNLGPTAGAPRMRVFCIPHGGAGAAAFGPWRGSHPDLELCAVQLPGRGDRWTEPPHTRIDALVEALADAIGPHLDLPFALFGASLGALLSFELAHALRRRGLQSPALLIAAACPAPHIPALLGRRDEIVQALAARDDLAAVQLGRLGILPEALVREPEVVRMSLPALRADFGIVLGYAHRPAPPLAVPLLALGGTEDPDVAADALQGWARYTTAPFRLHMLPGGHLFYREQPDARAEVLRACRQALTRE